MDRQTLIRNFSLNRPVNYHGESLTRLSELKTKELRHAAVLIGCVERHQGLNIILTMRAKHLYHHPGQISFPGGKHEREDDTLVDTAIRETEEEIGISAEMITVLGQLPQLATFSHFLVTPILALVNSDYQCKINPSEVDSVFEVPASHLFDVKRLYSQKFQFKHYSHRVFAISYKKYFIWGVTAQIIQALQLQLKS